MNITATLTGSRCFLVGAGGGLYNEKAWGGSNLEANHTLSELA